MPATVINLTVRSKNNGIYAAAATQDFVVSRMGEVLANQNLDTTNTVTEAGDTANQLSAWNLYGTEQLLYWKLTNPTGTEYHVDLYKGQNGANHVASGYFDNGTPNGTVYGTAVNQSGISFNVDVAYTADDTDNANTVQCTTFTAEYDLELPGTSQFTYEEQNGAISKYTVDETVAAINTAINGTAEYYEATTTLTTAQLTILNGTPVALVATPGSGKIIEVLSAVAIYYYGVAQYTVRTDIDIVSGTTSTQLWTAASAVAGTADKITRFVQVAGVMQSNEGLKAKMNTGNPTVGAGATGTCKIIVTYRINDI